MLTTAPSQSLAAQLARLLPDVRQLVGHQRRCTIVFDRGGYSLQVFTEIIAARFDILTYYKGTWVRSRLDAFTTVAYTAPDGTTQSYELAERTIELPAPSPTTGAAAAAAARHASARPGHGGGYGRSCDAALMGTKPRS